MNQRTMLSKPEKCWRRLCQKIKVTPESDYLDNLFYTLRMKFPYITLGIWPKSDTLNLLTLIMK